MFIIIAEHQLKSLMMTVPWPLAKFKLREKENKLASLVQLENGRLLNSADIAIITAFELHKL